MGWKLVTDPSTGIERKVRISKASGEEIPRPAPAVRNRVQSMQDVPPLS